MPYFTSAQIEAEMTALHAPPLCTKIALPNATVSEALGPTTYSYLKIANGTGSGRVAVLAVAGMHAREWAQPDAVISFARRLLAAYRGAAAFVIPAYTDSAGNTHGPVSVPATTIQRMVNELDILLVPCANPDGRTFSQAASANSGWRKNRAPRRVATNAATVGVDLNRNFDIAWDYDVFYTSAFAATTSTGGLSASKDPADDRFIGRPRPAPNATHPLNEPEVTNLIWILDHHPVTYSIDLHSYSMLLMHPWGIERNGSTSTQNFRNTAFDGARDGTLGNAYSEYFPNTAPTRLLDRHAQIVGAMRDRVRSATGRTYRVGGIADTIYPATGSFTDFHFSRQFTIASSPTIHAFAAEFGDPADNFQPSYTSAHGFPRIEREVHAVLLTLLESALGAAPATTSGGGSGSGSGSTSTCPFSVAADELLDGAGWLEALRAGRAAAFAFAPTRPVMSAVHRAYWRLAPRVTPLLVRQRWARRLVAYTVVLPAAAATRLALKGTTT